MSRTLPQRKGERKQESYAAPLRDEPEISAPDGGDGRIHLRDRDGRDPFLPGVKGLSLMEILRAADFPLTATCGGGAT